MTGNRGTWLEEMARAIENLMNRLRRRGDLSPEEEVDLEAYRAYRREHPRQDA